MVKRKLEEAEAREEALLRRITENEKTLNKMRWVLLGLYTSFSTTKSDPKLNFLINCSAVVESYEQTMIEMISEHKQTTQSSETQIAQLKAERDMNRNHLLSLETTFSDLHV